MTEQRDTSTRGKWERIKYAVKATVKKPFTLFEKDGNGGWDTHAVSRVAVMTGFMTEWMHEIFYTTGTYQPAWSIIVLVVLILGYEKALDKMAEIKNGKPSP